MADAAAATDAASAPPKAEEPTPPADTDVPAARAAEQAIVANDADAASDAGAPTVAVKAPPAADPDADADADDADREVAAAAAAAPSTDADDGVTEPTAASTASSPTRASVVRSRADASPMPSATNRHDAVKRGRSRSITDAVTGVFGKLSGRRRSQQVAVDALTVAARAEAADGDDGDDEEDDDGGSNVDDDDDGSDNTARTGRRSRRRQRRRSRRARPRSEGAVKPPERRPSLARNVVNAFQAATRAPLLHSLLAGAGGKDGEGADGAAGTVTMASPAILALQQAAREAVRRGGVVGSQCCDVCRCRTFRRSVLSSAVCRACGHDVGAHRDVDAELPGISNRTALMVAQALTYLGEPESLKTAHLYTPVKGSIKQARVRALEYFFHTGEFREKKYRDPPANIATFTRQEVAAAVLQTLRDNAPLTLYDLHGRFLVAVRNRRKLAKMATEAYLPRQPNALLLKYVLHHVATVVKGNKSNGLTLDAAARVFGDLLLRPREALHLPSSHVSRADLALDAGWRQRVVKQLLAHHLPEHYKLAVDADIAAADKAEKEAQEAAAREKEEAAAEARRAARRASAQSGNGSEGARSVNGARVDANETTSKEAETIAEVRAQSAADGSAARDSATKGSGSGDGGRDGGDGDRRSSAATSDIWDRLDSPKSATAARPAETPMSIARQILDNDRPTPDATGRLQPLDPATAVAVARAMQYVELEGENSSDLYIAECPSVRTQQDLVHFLRTGKMVLRQHEGKTLEEFHPFIVADAIKQCLREAEPLLTYDLYQRVIEAASLPGTAAAEALTALTRPHVAAPSAGHAATGSPSGSARAAGAGGSLPVHPNFLLFTLVRRHLRKVADCDDDDPEEALRRLALQFGNLLLRPSESTGMTIQSQTHAAVTLMFLDGMVPLPESEEIAAMVGEVVEAPVEDDEADAVAQTQGGGSDGADGDATSQAAAAGEGEGGGDDVDADAGADEAADEVHALPPRRPRRKSLVVHSQAQAILLNLLLEHDTEIVVDFESADAIEPPLEVGEVVHCRYLRRPKFYRAVVKEVYVDGSADVVYIADINAGVVERGLRPPLIRRPPDDDDGDDADVYHAMSTPDAVRRKRQKVIKMRSVDRLDLGELLSDAGGSLVLRKQQRAEAVGQIRQERQHRSALRAAKAKARGPVLTMDSLKRKESKRRAKADREQRRRDKSDSMHFADDDSEDEDGDRGHGPGGGGGGDDDDGAASDGSYFKADRRGSRNAGKPPRDAGGGRNSGARAGAKPADAGPARSGSQRSIGSRGSSGSGKQAGAAAAASVRKQSSGKLAHLGLRVRGKDGEYTEAPADKPAAAGSKAKSKRKLVKAPSKRKAKGAAAAAAPTAAAAAHGGTGVLEGHVEADAAALLEQGMRAASEREAEPAVVHRDVATDGGDGGDVTDEDVAYGGGTVKTRRRTHDGEQQRHGHGKASKKTGSSRNLAPADEAVAGSGGSRHSKHSHGHGQGHGHGHHKRKKAAPAGKVLATEFAAMHIREEPESVIAALQKPVLSEPRQLPPASHHVYMAKAHAKAIMAEQSASSGSDTDGSPPPRRGGRGGLAKPGADSDTTKFPHISGAQGADASGTAESAMRSRAAEITREARGLAARASADGGGGSGSDTDYTATFDSDASPSPAKPMRGKGVPAQDVLRNLTPLHTEVGAEGHGSGGKGKGGGGGSGSKAAKGAGIDVLSPTSVFSQGSLSLLSPNTKAKFKIRMNATYNEAMVESIRREREAAEKSFGMLNLDQPILKIKRELEASPDYKGMDGRQGTLAAARRAAQQEALDAAMHGPFALENAGLAGEFASPPKRHGHNSKDYDLSKSSGRGNAMRHALSKRGLNPSFKGKGGGKGAAGGVLGGGDHSTSFLMHAVLDPDMDEAALRRLIDVATAGDVRRDGGDRPREMHFSTVADSDHAHGRAHAHGRGHGPGNGGKGKGKGHGQGRRSSKLKVPAHLQRRDESERRFRAEAHYSAHARGHADHHATDLERRGGGSAGAAGDVGTGGGGGGGGGGAGSGSRAPPLSKTVGREPAPRRKPYGVDDTDSDAGSEDRGSQPRRRRGSEDSRASNPLPGGAHGFQSQTRDIDEYGVRRGPAPVHGSMRHKRKTAGKASFRKGGAAGSVTSGKSRRTKGASSGYGNQPKAPVPGSHALLAEESERPFPWMELRNSGILQ